MYRVKREFDVNSIKFHKSDEDRKALLVAVAMMLAGFCFLAFLSLKPDKSGGDIAAIFSPNKSLTEIVLAVSTLPYVFVRTGFSDSIVILRPLKTAQTGMLRDAGALLIVDAYANGGCAFLTQKPTEKLTEKPTEKGAVNERST